jgi:hypothetical protein
VGSRIATVASLSISRASFGFRSDDVQKCVAGLSGDLLNFGADRFVCVERVQRFPRAFGYTKLLPQPEERDPAERLNAYSAGERPREADARVRAARTQLAGRPGLLAALLAEATGSAPYRLRGQGRQERTDERLSDPGAGWTRVDTTARNERFVAVCGGRCADIRIRANCLQRPGIRRYIEDAGGGTRTPDTRIMIPLL